MRRLLAAADLPLAGVDEHVESLWVDVEDGVVVGAIAFERYGKLGLLRSLVVDPERRGLGLGAALLDAGLRAMAKAGIHEAYGLTTTVAPWLENLGWTELSQAGLPPALVASKQLQGACPASARAFRLSLVKSADRPASGSPASVAKA